MSLNPIRQCHAVLGASGDIGSALVSFIDKGTPDFVNAVFRSLSSVQSYHDRSEHQLLRGQYSVVTNFQDMTQLENIIKNSNIIYLLAAALGLDKNKYLKDIAINGIMQIQIIKMAEKINSNIRLIFGSSHVIYKIMDNDKVIDWTEKALEFIENKNILETVKNEEDLIILTNELVDQISLPENISAYAIAKLLVEKYLIKSKLNNFVSFRISSSYGAGSLSGRSIQRMIEAKLNSETISMHQEARDYIDLQDLAKILCQAGISENLKERHFFDAASGQIKSPQEIWDLIVKFLPGTSGNINFVGDPRQQSPQDIEVSNKLLGKNFVSFDEGVKDQIDWIKRYLKKSQSENEEKMKVK